MPRDIYLLRYYAFGSLIPERSGEANCVPCGVLAQAIKSTYASTLDDTWTNSSYMTNITAEFTSRGFTLPAGIDDVADVLALCSLTAQNPESTGEVDMVWDDDADRKRTICPDGSLSFTNDYDQYNYRFGFNGKEMDDDMKGEGNSIAFEARIYDSRLGRFLSRDPRERDYPMQSTYVFAHNNPVYLIDYMGMGDPPKSTKEQANKLIDDFGKNLAQSTYFENVSPELFISQLKERVNNPSGLNQGHGTNFCWAAACASYIYEKDPEGMVGAMFNLYNEGTFLYNNGTKNFSITPYKIERDAVGSKTFDDDVGLTGKLVDQMLFMTLASGSRKYINILDLNYTPGQGTKADPGDEDGAWAGGPLAKEIDLWHAFGYDINVTGYDVFWGEMNKGQLVATALKTKDVVLYVNSEMFKFGTGYNATASHYIRVSQIVSSENYYSVSYWDYGGFHHRTLTHSDFWRSTYGLIQIPR